MSTPHSVWPSVIIHFMNFTEHAFNATSYGHDYLREFTHVPHVLRGMPVYLTGVRENCLFNYNYFDKQVRASYQTFYQENTVLILLGRLNEADLLKLVRFCYPWVATLCSSQMRGNLQCCDAFYENRKHDLPWSYWLRTASTSGRRPQIVSLSEHACGKCGTYSSGSAGKPFEITSRDSAISCRVPPNQWTFTPHGDHSLAFHDIQSEHYLPYGNRLLKVLSEVFNFSFRFETGPQTDYGMYFQLDENNHTKSEWDGSLNSLNVRRCFLAIGSLRSYTNRHRFFTPSIAFLVNNVVLVNKARRSESNRCILADDLTSTDSSYMYLTIVASFALIARLLDRHISFFRTFASLSVMSALSTMQTAPRRCSALLTAYRMAIFVITLHISVRIFGTVLTPHFDYLYTNIAQVHDHLRRFPAGRVWGYEPYLTGIVSGLQLMQNSGEPMTRKNQLLYDLLTTKRRDFGEQPKTHKLTVYAGKNPHNFIVDDELTVDFFRDWTDKKSYINTIANLNNIYETILFQRGCMYERPFSRVLRRLAETGHVSYWVKGHHYSSVREVTIAFKELSLESFGALFPYVIVLVFLAAGSFLLELLIHECVIEWHSRFDDPSMPPCYTPHIVQSS